MPRVSVPRHRIADGSLPPVCVVCGKHAPHRLFPGISAPSAAWVLAPLIGLLAFRGYILFGGGGRPNGWQPAAGLPFCDAHRGYWKRRAGFIIGGILFLVLVGVVAGVASSLRDDAARPAPPAGRTSGSGGAGDEGPHWLFGVLGCGIVLYLPAFVIAHMSGMRPTGGGHDSLVLSGASEQFAAALSAGGPAPGRPPWPPPPPPIGRAR